MDLPINLEVADKIYEVNYQSVSGFRSSARIKNGVVVMKLSRFLIGNERQKTVKKFLNWASKKLSKINHNEIISPEYSDGGIIRTHNKIYQLNVNDYDGKISKVFLREGYLIEIYLYKNLSDRERQEYTVDLVQKIIIKDNMEYLKSVIDELNGLYFREEIAGCRFKRIKSRFGSCSSKRNINIAFRLLFAPKDVFRYVCAHELAHLKEFNHSKRFWQLVETAMSDYRKQEKWLKENGFVLG